MKALELTLPEELIEAIAQRAAEIIQERGIASGNGTSWLTVEEAAEHVRCPKSRIYALVSAKRIPHDRDGSRLIFNRMELDEWIRNGGGKRP